MKFYDKDKLINEIDDEGSLSHLVFDGSHINTDDIKITVERKQ